MPAGDKLSHHDFAVDKIFGTAQTDKADFQDSISRGRVLHFRITLVGRAFSPMSLSFPTSEHLHKLWGGPPGPQPAPWPASRVRQEIDSKRRAGPGGPARTRGSAPQKSSSPLQGASRLCLDNRA